MSAHLSVPRNRHASRVARFALGAVLSSMLVPIAEIGAQVTTSPSSKASPAARLLDSARAIITKATPAGDTEELRSAQALLERALTVSPNDPWLTHYLGFALYREATLSFGQGRDNYGPILERADSVLERAVRLASVPESHALRSGVLGMMIGPNPIRGMTLGPKSSAQMERALALAPNNPRVWLMRGIGAFNTPAMFGGGMDRSEEYLKKSIELFATDQPQAPAPSWGAYEAHIWLGRVYANQDRIDDARASYQKALALEPNDMWTRMVLLPALEKKK